MGIADYGVTAAGVPYNYSTPILLGTANVSSLLTNSGGPVPGAGYMTFQLNCELVLESPSGNWSYWVQNVVSIETQAHYIGFENNIWNFSDGVASGTGLLTSGMLSGRGTVNQFPGIGDWYAYGDAGDPGNGITWYAGVFSVEVVSIVVAGLPHVVFEYNDGFGWIAYDNVSFLNGANTRDLGFFVSGSTYAPICFSGTPTVCEVYDAEFDFTGAGGSDTDVSSNLTLGLQYWNGHNMEATPSAWNFGYNTGEQISNVVSTLATNPVDGSLFARETNGSAGTFGELYDASTSSQLHVLLPSAPAGTVRVGTQSIQYVGGEANLTLAPGTYSVAAFYPNSTTVGVATVQLSRGSAVSLTLPIPTFDVKVDYAGLPAGTAVNISLVGTGGTQVPSMLWTNLSWTTSVPNTAVGLLVVNGSYRFVVGPVPGYVPSAYRGSFQVNGAGAEITIDWRPFTYDVVVSASGLPPGVPWGVLLGSIYLNSTGSPLSVPSPNGTYAYWVYADGPYTPNPQTGQLSVSAGAAPLSVTFTAQPSHLRGAISPVGAVLELNGFDQATSGGTYDLLVIAGAYNLSVSSSGYASQSRTVSVTAGNSSFSNFTLAAMPVSSHSGSASGSFGLSPIALTLLVVGAVAAVSVLALLLRRRA
ncbi:MAG: thermopsin family protease [Thermoplasmata archaeon]|nr:thermopsin family protease [Thermoplasmata archaeon]